MGQFGFVPGTGMSQLEGGGLVLIGLLLIENVPKAALEKSGKDNTSRVVYEGVHPKPNQESCEICVTLKCGITIPTTNGL